MTTKTTFTEKLYNLLIERRKNEGLEKRVSELEKEVEKMHSEQSAFTERTTKIMQSVLNNDKRKFMYELQHEDVELIEDGHKYRKIRKILQ